MRLILLAFLFLISNFQSVEALGLNPLPGYLTVYYQLLDKNGTITLQKMANSGWNQVGVVEDESDGQMNQVETGEYFFIYWSDKAGENKFDVYAAKIKRGNPKSGTRDEISFDKLGSYEVPTELNFHYNEPLPKGWVDFQGHGSYVTVKSPRGGTLRILVLYHKYQDRPTFRR